MRTPHVLPFPATSASPLALLTADLIELARERGRVVPLEALQVRGWTPAMVGQLRLEAATLAAETLGFEPLIQGREVPVIVVRLPSRWTLFRRPCGAYQWGRA
jgi:hypothetical protein